MTVDPVTYATKAHDGHLEEGNRTRYFMESQSHVRKIASNVDWPWLFIKSFIESKTCLLMLVALCFRTNSALSLFLNSQSQHTCAAETNKPNDNGLKCWGLNMYGQLGQGNTLNIGDGPDEMGSFLANIDTGFSATEIAHVETGGRSTCALTTTNKVKCFGHNMYGQLGQGNTVNMGDASGTMGDSLPFIDLGTNPPIQIAAGYDHTCALLFNATKNEIKCWGKNNFGQLGYGDTNNRGDEANEMGDNLLSVDLGSNFYPVQITSGAFHTCVLSNSSKVKCWGYNIAGQLGYLDTINRGGSVGEMGDNLPFVDLGTNFVPVHIASGYKHVCGLSNAGTVKCWGWNGYGCLGYGDTISRGDAAGDMGDNLALVDLGTNFTATQIDMGSYHSCALSTTHDFKCWGSNSYGNLGYGDSNNKGDEPGEMGDNLPFVDLGIGFNTSISEIKGAVYHTCAASLSDEVKCWGRGANGMLGYPEANNVGDSPGEMGNNAQIVDLVFVSPTNNPTNNPSKTPTNDPTTSPTNDPTKSPSNNPSKSPTNDPTISPSNNPSKSPSNDPSKSPSNDPTTSASNNPSKFPSNNPSKSPTNDPTTSPTNNPTGTPISSTIDPATSLTALIDVTEPFDAATYVQWSFGTMLVAVYFALFSF